MQPSDLLIDNLLATTEICGATMSKPAAKMLAQDLSYYPEEQVLGALKKCRQEVTGRLTLAAVLSRLDDGRPGPEEAWAAMPKDEADSAVLTQEQISAWAIAKDLHAADPVGARMAFRESYNRLVAEARAARQPAQWIPSLGHDPAGRAGAILDGVTQGRLSQSHAMAFGYEPPKLEALQGPRRDIKSLISSALAGKVAT